MWYSILMTLAVTLVSSSAVLCLLAVLTLAGTPKPQARHEQPLTCGKANCDCGCREGYPCRCASDTRPCCQERK